MYWGFTTKPFCISGRRTIHFRKDFYVKAHATIYKVLKNSILKGDNVDSVIVSQKLKVVEQKILSENVLVMTFQYLII